MSDRTIDQDYADNPVDWDGTERIPVVKSIGSPPTAGNAAGLASTLLAWIKSFTGLSDLNDVDIAGSPGPADGDTLTYDSATQMWIASAPTTGSSTLAALTDTDVAGSPSPAEGQVLTWRQTLQKWVASTLPASSASLAGLTDTDIAGSPTPANGQVLTYIAAVQKWVAATSSVGASTTQTDEMISGYIGTVADKTYKLVVKVAHVGTITEATAISESGTCTATFKINTTALGGTANSVTSTESSQSHGSANAFSAGDDIQLTVSSNAACLGLSFTLKYTRVYA